MTIHNIFEKKPSKSEGCQVSGKKKKHFPRKMKTLMEFFFSNQKSGYKLLCIQFHCIYLKLSGGN